MKIVLMNQGLGNQMFQYVFYRWLELKTGESCLIDDSYFFTEPGFAPTVGQVIRYDTMYGLERVFGLQPNLLSRYFDEDVWAEMLAARARGVSIPQQLSNNGFDMFLFGETDDFIYEGNIVMMPANHQPPDVKYMVQSVKGNVYFHGYWITNDWIRDIYPQMKQEFAFPALRTAEDRETLKKIESTNSCGIHIRRGDFVNIGWSLDPKFYRDGVEKIRASMGRNPVFFVFSDDISWCRQNAGLMGLDLPGQEVIYIEGHHDPDNPFDAANDYVDMQLMTYCKGMVMSQSAFCYMATLLNGNLKNYVNPTTRGLERTPTPLYDPRK